MKLSGNVILITGGSAGIGLAFARALLALSNKVIICGRNRERLDAARAQTPGLITTCCDISSPADQAALCDYLEAEHPDLNVLINNAGVQFNYTFTDGQSHLEQINQEIQTNFLAQVTLTDRLLPLMTARDNPAIINVTSALATVPKENAAVYCATKAALRSFTKTLRYQLEDQNVYVCEIVPALVETAMTAGRGKGKITPALLVEEALAGMNAGKTEIRIGKTKVLFALHRLLPGLADSILRHS